MANLRGQEEDEYLDKVTKSHDPAIGVRQNRPIFAAQPPNFDAQVRTGSYPGRCRPPPVIQSAIP